LVEKIGKNLQKFGKIRKNFKKLVRIARNWCFLDSDCATPLRKFARSAQKTEVGEQKTDKG
jgi:hypothetical protein